MNFEQESPVESAVMRRLSSNWHRRAVVKKPEPDLDDLFERDRPDFPLFMTPLHGHPVMATLADETVQQMLFFAGLAFHKFTIEIESEIVAPAFAGVLSGRFPVVGGPQAQAAIVQATVDEQYHSLLHLNAARVMQDHRRPWALDSRALPLSDLVTRHHLLRSRADHAWQRDLIRLAFATVVEVAIGGYLELAAKDKDIQPVNSATAAIHWRDEECHGSLAADFALGVFRSLDPERQRYFMTTMVEAARQFSEKDFTLWHAIVDLVGAPHAHDALKEAYDQPGSRILRRDYRPLARLWTTMAESSPLDLDWAVASLPTVSLPTASLPTASLPGAAAGRG
ncbi:diiron oxygenase [Kitasatospora sp. LaBMicrA B282]|uniref:diiron oxygenase n=1 Tax=Kitasatospora sp. LaBMicrA B282 TaxID=3420949 RepID=UPI003D0E405B